MSHLVPDSLSPQALEHFLHEKIPLTKAMALRVVETGPRFLVLEAPLAPNINHLDSAFGGSLHAVPTLACYAALWKVVRGGGLDAHVVVKRSYAHYRQPVRGAIRAHCELPPPGIAAEFIDDLKRHRKARMDLEAIVEGADDTPAVDFHGSFVALL